MSVATLPLLSELLKTLRRSLLGLSGVTHNLLSFILALDELWLHLGYSKVIDPLGPLLFSLVLMQFINFVKLHDSHCIFGIWMMGLKILIAETFRFCPQFGLHLNLSKCELFWPSGSLNFLPTSTKLVKVWNSCVPLFGVQTIFLISSCIQSCGRSR